MKLKHLISGLDCRVLGANNRDILSLEHVAQKAGKKSMFFCLNGRNARGEDFAAEAIKNGCKVIVAENSIVAGGNITQILVNDTRKAISEIASAFYGNPASKLKIIGVTGTNGKTTTTSMIAHILKSCGHNVGIIGTLGASYCGKHTNTGFTTPDPIILQQIFADMVDCGVEYVVMEVSAHAIYLHKLWGIILDVIAFTNLSQDHLDYFDNMENYYQAKKMIFDEPCHKYAIVCTDSPYGRRLSSDCKGCITCSTNGQPADINAQLLEHTISGQSFSIASSSGRQNFSLNLLGQFNLQNATVAISCCMACGLTLPQISNSLASLKGVDGRFESYSNGKCTIIVDYAHTPDGLNNLLKTAKEVAGKNRLISVFGCGGNRDTDKRPQMAQISEQLADYTIVTTDNPRFEDNYKIAQDICSGFTKNKYMVLLDRGQAVRKAVSICKTGDIIALSGKGAEDYIDVCGKKIDFSDKLLAQKALEETNFLD